MNIVVVTARTDSARLPNKALVKLGTQSNLVRIVRRFEKCKTLRGIIVATSTDATDDVIEQECIEHKLNYCRGSKDDVLQRVIEATQTLRAKILQAHPELEKEKVWVLRATTDCPFISPEIVDMGFRLMCEYSQFDSARLWGMTDRTVPVYGACEFPVSLDCLVAMDKHFQFALGQEPLAERIKQGREHVTSDLDYSRLEYKVVYPVPPKVFTNTFYRPYRLELDTPSDLKMVNAILGQLGEQPSLQQVIHYLDDHPNLTQINSGISEKTGPLTSYTREQMARWKSQQSNHTIEWRGDWSWLENGYPAQLPTGAKPLYCHKGLHYLGYVNLKGSKHQLVTPSGDVIIGRASLGCACASAAREWHEG